MCRWSSKEMRFPTYLRLIYYCSSVDESIGETPQYLEFGHEFSLPHDLMFSPPQSTEPDTLHDWVLQKQNAFPKAYEFVGRNATAEHRRRNSLYNKRVHGPTHEEGEHILLHYHDVRVSKSPKLASPWRGPYQILKIKTTLTIKSRNLLQAKSMLYIMIAWDDIMAQYQLCLMSRHDQQPTLPVTRPTQSPISITQTVFKHFYF